MIIINTSIKPFQTAENTHSLQIYWVCNKSNMTGTTCGVGNAYPSSAPEFTPCF